MPSEEHFDAIVIGSGQAGTPLCQALAFAGMRTALVERTHVGGTCINEGCTPTKTMIASGRVAYLARRAKDYGVETGRIRISMEKIRKRKRAIVELFRGGSESRISKTPNLEWIRGEARFTGPKSIEVEAARGKARPLTAERIFINAGCRPAVPAIPGLAKVPFLDSTSIMELARVPEHLLVLGGGVVGLEFGQLFRRLGSRVTIVHSGAQLLAREDPDIVKAITEILKQDGISILLRTAAQSVAQRGKKIVLSVTSGMKKREVIGSHLLVATGRAPNSDSLALAAAGIAADSRGYIRVNEKLETNVSGIYALGDIKGDPAFTHISYDDFRIIRTNVIEKGSASTAGRMVPYCTFTDPQLGRIGITETEARARGLKIRVAKMPMTYVARALETDESRGLMKAIVDAESSQILGASILGIEGGEIMAQIQIAMMGGLPYQRLQNGVFAHPTLAESLNNLFNHFVEQPEK